MYKWLLILSLGIASGTILFDKYVASVPDYIAIILSIIAIICMLVYVAKNKKYKEK